MCINIAMDCNFCYSFCLWLQCTFWKVKIQNLYQLLQQTSDIPGTFLLGWFELYCWNYLKNCHHQISIGWHMFNNSLVLIYVCISLLVESVSVGCSSFLIFLSPSLWFFFFLLCTFFHSLALQMEVWIFSIFH